MGQEQKGANTNDVQPPNFRLGGQGACSFPNVAIPDLSEVGVTDTLVIPCPVGPIADLDVMVQISHTWVGDLEVMLTKVGGPSAVLIDRPGLQPPLPPPGSCCGCSGNDIDAFLDDSAATDVESECAAGVPTIQGSFIAGDPGNNMLLGSFNSEDLCGTWELRVRDGAGADIGTLNGWCLLVSDIGDPPVPASSRTAILVLGALLLLGSTYFLIRRRKTA